jgi:DNA-binding response OmpR family regulator
MSGHDLVERARAHFPSMPVLFMSGYTEGDVVRQGSVTSEDHFLEKPFTPEAFAHTVRNILDEKA